MLSYVLNGCFVEVTLPDNYALAELRELYLTVRADPLLPRDAVMLFDTRARVSSVSYYDRQARTALFVELLSPRLPLVCAMVTTPASQLAGKDAQVEAGELGLRIGLFTDIDDARRWLRVYAQDSVAD